MFKMRKCGACMKASEFRSLIVLLLALFALAVTVTRASGQAPQPPVIQTANAQVNAGEYSFYLVADYKNNKPVLDLESGEIAISEDNSPVKLDNLRLVNGKQESNHLIILVIDRMGYASGTGQAVVSSKLKDEHDAAAKILNMVPEKGFSFSVLNIDGRLRLQNEFTSDRKALAQALTAATKVDKSAVASAVTQPEKQLVTELQKGTDSSGKPLSAGDRALDMALYSALSQSGRIAQDQHIPLSWAGLLALSQAMKQIPQRKTVIFFTSFQKMQVDSHARDAIKTVIGAANQAGSSIYVVDLKTSSENVTQMSGKNLSFLKASPGSQASGSTPGLPMLRTGYLENNVQENEDLRYLAEGTGGSYIVKDRLQQPMKRMIQDMTTYYEASYHSPIMEYDGKFHSVDVKPVRHGLKISYPKGYIASPPHAVAGDNPQPFELPLQKILGESQLPADLLFRAAILRMEVRPEGDVNTLAIEVPLSSLEVREDYSTKLYAAHLSVLANIKDSTGTVIEHFSADIPRRGALKDIDMAKFEAISMERYFTAAPGKYILEAAVLDQNSGKAGAQRITFEIPNASAMPSLGDMVIVRQTEPARAEGDPSDPLRHGSDEVIPNLSGQLPAGAKDVSVFFIAHVDQHAADTATLNIQVIQNGKPLGGPSPKAVHGAESEFSSYLDKFSITQPMDGEYEVKATLSQGDKTAQSSATFTLSGFRQASADAVDPDLPPLDSVAHPAGALVISYPETPIQAPPPDELKAILADAGQHAIDYKSLLPNFMCNQITNRSVDLNGSMTWKLKDTLTERLTYLNQVESRKTLEVEVNGQKSDSDVDQKVGMITIGEFGYVLSNLFRPASKADFEWKKTGTIADEKVQVYDYRVARDNSTFTLRTGSNDVITVGYHGQVFIENSTRRVRRITQVADDVPKKCPVHAVSVSVDYDYVMINKHDYLLPVGAQIMVRKGYRETDLNEIEFRNFHRFSSNLKVLDFSPEVIKP